jgi:DNA-binding transcriptional MocR family regulator
MAAITQLKNTLYVGSFSKSVSASLRTGFIAGDKGHIEELADMKMLLHIGSSEYGERILESILREGNFLRHITRLQDRLRSATEEGLKVLESFAAETFSSPTQSLYLWARFPGILDTRALTARMLQRSVVLAPGAFFHTNPEQISPWTRLNVAYLQDEHFIRSMRLELE